MFYIPLPFPTPTESLQILCLAVQLLTHPLENLHGFNFLLSFPAGYQIEKTYLITVA